LSSPESTPPQSPAALVVKPSKPFAGNAVVISSSPEAPPDLTDPPPVAANPPETSVRMPAVEAPQPQAPPPVQQQALLPSPEPTATVPTSTPIAPPQPSATTSNYTPPRPISKAAPKFPVELKTHVTKPHLVEVRVSIDEHGRVTRADAVPQKGITEFFVEATVSAARLWRFEPARRDNQPVPSEMTLQFLLDR
jgi:protein TonB